MMRLSNHKLLAVAVVSVTVVGVILMASPGKTSAKFPARVDEPLPYLAEGEKDPGSTAPMKLLVLTYNRGPSLSRCLDSLNAAHYDGHRVDLEIFIDRSKKGSVHNATVQTARDFVFKHGSSKVKVREKHGGVIGQWLESWSMPPENESEIAVFVEDDISLSPFFARYLRKVHGKYDSYPGVNGYALQSESILHGKGAKKGGLRGPPGQLVFVYPILGSWGFSPNTRAWRHFIKWYQDASQKKGFSPSVPGLMATDWYNGLKRAGRADSMWTMWHIHHAYENHLYTVYANLPGHKGLAVNWKEPGEHFSGASAKGMDSQLFTAWDEGAMLLPQTLAIIDAKGNDAGKIGPPPA